MNKVLLAPVMALATIALAALTLLGCNVSTANVSNPQTCDQLDGNVCPGDEGTFDPSTPVFYVSADLNNAPSGTKIDITWRYLGGELGGAQDIDTVTLTSEEDSNTLQSSLEKGTSTWPRGDYEVVLKIQTDNAEPVHKTFSVK